MIAKNSLSAYLEAEAHLLSWRTYLNRLLWLTDYITIKKSISEAERLQLGHTVYQEGGKARFENFQIIYETHYKDKKSDVLDAQLARYEEFTTCSRCCLYS